MFFLAVSRTTCCRLSLAQDLISRQQQRLFNGRSRSGFLSQFMDNVKNEMEENNEMRENIRKFREELEKLEQSEALQTARQKFNMVELEAQKSTHTLMERYSSIKEKITDVLDEATKTEVAKKATQITEDLTKGAKGVAETTAFQAISDTTKMIRKEINPQHIYIAPKKLRKRVEVDTSKTYAYEPNGEATGMELHKDSKFYQSWENFKNNNAYVNTVLDWKMKYEESENPVIRASRLLTDKVSDVMGGLFSKTDLSETLTEICKLDPNFDQKQFFCDCETDIIPNILEAMVQGNLEILKDWCFEAPYHAIATPITQAFQNGLYLDSKILDIKDIELAMGKIIEQGPVLVITFQAQQVMCVRERSSHKIVEGNPEKVMRVNYVWVLCRDPKEINTKAAWRLMEFSANSEEQFV